MPRTRRHSLPEFRRTTNNLLGVRMVLTDGQVVDLGGVHLDAPGLDLLGIVCGSEGQLAIITEATLRILPKPEGARPVMIAFDDAEVAGECVARIIKSGGLPVAIEYMDRPCICVVENYAQAGYPMCEALLIVEVAGSEAEIVDQLGRITKIAESLNPVEVRVSQSEAQSALIWKCRKSAFGAVGQINDYMYAYAASPQMTPIVGPRQSGEIGRLQSWDVASLRARPDSCRKHRVHNADRVCHRGAGCPYSGIAGLGHRRAHSPHTDG